MAHYCVCVVCLCVFMIIIHVELLWYNEASWGISTALNLCCPSSFIKHTLKCMQARPQTHKHTKIRQISNLSEQCKHKHTTPRTLAHVNIQFIVAGLVSGFLSAYTPAHGGWEHLKHKSKAETTREEMWSFIQQLPLLASFKSNQIKSNWLIIDLKKRKVTSLFLKYLDI